MTEPVRTEMQGDIALIRIDNPPVTASGLAVRQGLVDAARGLSGGPARAVVVVAEGRTFIAGADITEFGKPPVEPFLPDVIDALERLEVPVVCVIHGTALGGGLEVALGCHYRVMLKGAKLGLPEVNLGLIPGAGGTQRLPRLCGVVAAAEIFTSARMVGADEALALGIVDAVAEGTPDAAGLAFARDLLAQGKGVRRVSELPVPPTDEAALEALRAKVAKANPGHVCHLRGIDVAVEGTKLPFAEGMKIERQGFRDLMQTPQRAAMIHAFFGERKVAQVPELKGIQPRPVAHLGVIGGGTMGGGIAVSGLLNGLRVTLIERDAASADKARDGIAGVLADSVKRGKLAEGKRDTLLAEALVTSADYAALAEADVIVEAVFEAMEVKREVFGKLDAVAKPGAVLATNTSYLDVDEIARATSRPADVLGLHFFSPAHVMRLLEVVVADATAPEVAATGFALAKALKKVPVRAGVCDGFIGNRMLRHYRLAADHLVLAGASVWQIDRVLEGFGFAMGPFKVSDLAGIDIGYYTRQRLRPTKPPEERWGDWADRLHELGRLGRKTGRGYYIYDADSPRGRPDAEVDAIIAAERRDKGITPRAVSDDEIVDRYMAAMINEGARIVDEGIARRPLDVDVVKLYGYGFPRFRGGPMHYADQIGLDRVRATIRDAAAEDAWFWRPAPLLERLAAEGRTFASLNEG
jgi:3-hydroxyacyl-CoA dehydrogenase